MLGRPYYNTQSLYLYIYSHVNLYICICIYTYLSMYLHISLMWIMYFIFFDKIWTHAGGAILRHKQGLSDSAGRAHFRRGCQGGRAQGRGSAQRQDGPWRGGAVPDRVSAPAGCGQQGIFTVWIFFRALFTGLFCVCYYAVFLRVSVPAGRI